MIKRPLNAMFQTAVKDGQKTTTIRAKPWPIGVPIMLYHWTGKAYRSPQQDVAAIVVSKVQPIIIEQFPSGQLVYHYPDILTHGTALWFTEGFNDGHEMDAWFRPLVKLGKPYHAHLMTFALHHP
jgi:hypothetical protein